MRKRALAPSADPPSTHELLRELVAHLQQNRTLLREEWARRITEAKLLTAMSKDEIFAEATAVYDNYVEALESGTFEALQAYARNLSERIIPRGVETHEVIGIVLLLRDVLARSLFAKYQSNFALLNRILDAYEPAVNRISNTVAVGFVQERERVIREQQEAIRVLSTPVLQVRERLLILPIIGVIDPQRARQLTEQLLRGIRTNRAKVVVIDITGVPVMDANVANHLVQTVEATRLLGATVIITGLSPEIAQTLVTIGVDLGKMNTVGDLQGGIEEAERLLGYKVVPMGESFSFCCVGRSTVEVPILKQGPYLIASIQSALSDEDLVQLRDALVAQVGKLRSRGVIVDVTVLDVMDSFATRTLRDIALYDPAPRRGNGHCGNSARSCFCLGSSGLEAGRGCHGPRSGRRNPLPESEDDGIGQRDEDPWAMTGIEEGRSRASMPLLPGTGRKARRSSACPSSPTATSSSPARGGRNWRPVSASRAPT